MICTIRCQDGRVVRMQVEDIVLLVRKPGPPVSVEVTVRGGTMVAFTGPDAGMLKQELARWAGYGNGITDVD